MGLQQSTLQQHLVGGGGGKGGQGRAPKALLMGEKSWL